MYPGSFRAIHIEVKSLKNQDSSIGHNKYKYNIHSTGKPNELYWFQVKEDYSHVRNQGKTQAGLPACLYDRMFPGEPFIV